MTDIFSEFATDEVGEVAGVLVPYKDSQFQIARANNPEFIKVLEAETAPHRLVLDKGDEKSDELFQQIYIRVLAKSILKGWQNVNFKGKPLEYTYDNAVKLLELKEFRAWVRAQSNDLENFKFKQVEEAVDNLSKS